MNIRCILAIAGVLAVSGTGQAQPSRESVRILGETNPLAALSGNRFDGTWWLTSAGTRPLILSLTRAGGFSLQDSADFGGFTPVSFSPVRGIWTRTGGRTAEAVGIRFVVEPDGKIRAAERVLLNLELSGDFQQLSGDRTLEEVFCETVEPPPPGRPFPSCPDVTVAPAEVVRGPVPFTAVRLPLDR